MSEHDGWCLGCGAPSEARIDKKGRPYFKCRMCALTIFMASEVAVAGIAMARELVRSVGADKWRSAVSGVILQGGNISVTRSASAAADQFKPAVEGVGA